MDYLLFLEIIHLLGVFLELTKFYDYVRFNIDQKVYANIIKDFIYLFYSFNVCF